MLPLIIFALKLEKFIPRQVGAVCSPGSGMGWLYTNAPSGGGTAPQGLWLCLYLSAKVTAGGVGALPGFAPDEIMDLCFGKLTARDDVPAFIAE